MKIATLKNKLIAGSLTAVILVMLASAVVMSVVINNQNKTASFDSIDKSLNIIRYELSVTQAKLLSDARQMATTNEVGATLQFVSDFKDDVSMTQEPLSKLAYGIGQIGRTGNLWKAAIYDLEGQLIAFTLRRGGGEVLLGMISDQSKGTPMEALMKEGQELDWKDSGGFQDEMIKPKFQKQIPRDETIFFTDINQSLCLIAFAPIYSAEIGDGTKKAIKKQVGFALGVRKLDQSFMERASRLTSMKINLFQKSGLIFGDLKDYTELKTKRTDASPDSWDLKNGKIWLNEVSLKTGDYFQGVLPLYGEKRFVGAIAALQSTAIGKANTWQMARLLGLVYLFCILVLVPCIIFFSRSLTHPIKAVITALNKTSHMVSSASAQVSVSSQQLAEGSSEQAAALEETSSALEEVSETIKTNANSAEEADNLNKETNQIVGKANRSMDQLTSSMNEITKASEETSKIIKTIDEIAFQTNLLALNAAVEAARAGEAGAGFAVVADEVRGLALRAADAAKNTSQLIEDTTKKVKEGNSLVTDTAEAFSEVSESAGKAGKLTAEIATASIEQAQNIEQINRAVKEMDKVIQANAANAEESASASQELDAEATTMKQVVRDLVRLVGETIHDQKKDILTRKANGDSPLSRSGPKASDASPQINRPQKRIAQAEAEKSDPFIPMDDEDDFREF